MEHFFTQDQRDQLYYIFIEILTKPREFPHGVNQIAAEMMVRIDGFMQYQELEKKSFSENIQNSEEQNLDDPHFHGSDYQKGKDQKRLIKGMLKVFEYMLDGQWRTIPEISEATGVYVPSVLRYKQYLARPEWGGHFVDKKRMTEDGGVWLYRLIPNKESFTWKWYLEQKPRQPSTFL